MVLILSSGIQMPRALLTKAGVGYLMVADPNRDVGANCGAGSGLNKEEGVVGLDKWNKLLFAPAISHHGIRWGNWGLASLIDVPPIDPR